jgi:hypothetical protein
LGAVTARIQRNSVAFCYYVTPYLNCRPKYFFRHCHIIDFSCVGGGGARLDI